MMRETDRRANATRRGVGLLEVIACTALVAVMIIPIAGVLRASTQSIARANGSTSTQAELRRGLRWLSDTIRDGDVLLVRSDRMQVRLAGGGTATIQVRRGTLSVDDGRLVTVIAENVRDIRFTELVQTAPPRTRIGISIALRGRDPETGSLVTVEATVAIAPQA